MKILHIVEAFASGVLNFLAPLTRHQVETNDVYILWGERPLTPSSVNKLFDKRVHLLKVKSFHGALGTVFNPQAYFEVRRMYEQIKPDIVHLHSSAAGFVGRWALPCKKVKVFYTPHGFSFKEKGILGLKGFLYKTIEQISALRPAKIVACGKSEYSDSLKITSNCTYVNNGIDTDFLKTFVSPTDIVNKQHIRICTVGRILYPKEPAFFNKIALLLPSIQFVWIGDGDLRSQLTAPNIKITGWCSREEAMKELQQSDIFILTSRHEGLPLALLEALYLQKFSLVTNVVGNKDVIRHGYNGMLCDSPEDFAQTIQSSLKGEIDIAKIVRTAAGDIMENYSLDKMFQGYARIYQS